MNAVHCNGAQAAALADALHDLVRDVGERALDTVRIEQVGFGGIVVTAEAGRAASKTTISSQGSSTRGRA